MAAIPLSFCSAICIEIAHYGLAYDKKQVEKLSINITPIHTTLCIPLPILNQSYKCFSTTDSALAKILPGMTLMHIDRMSISYDIVVPLQNLATAAKKTAREKMLYLKCLVQSVGLLLGNILATCNHFQRESVLHHICQNVNASSGWRLHLCLGLGWPTVDGGWRLSVHAAAVGF